jgi:ubiquinone/menaquinone biosynthesis C-methylase UbiE
MENRKKKKIICRVIWITSTALLFLCFAAVIVGWALLVVGDEDFTKAGKAIEAWCLPFAFAFLTVLIADLTYMAFTKVKQDNLDYDNANLREYWNKVFQGAEPAKIEEKDINITGEFEKDLLFLNEHCPKILDVGCGGGEMLMKMAFHSKGNTYVGVDQSSAAIAFASKTAKLSDLNDINFGVGGFEMVRKIPANSFDGVLTSNFLDVIPLKTAKDFAKEITEIVKPGGYLLLKINFFLDEEYVKKSKGEYGKDGGVYIKGILRSNNQPSSYWINLFSAFSLVSQGEFQRNPTGPADRVFLFKKN